MMMHTQNVAYSNSSNGPTISFTIYKVPSMNDLQQESCLNVQLLPDSDRCSFVQQAPDCLTESSFIPYLQLLFCEFDTSSRYIGVIICVVWLILMFFLLGKSANDFFCPALTVIARVLGLSENLAGVTVLAFGNGSPDIFTSLVGAPRGRSELVFGELIGSGLFVTSVIAGSICTVRPFKLMERPFLRDVIFYLGAVYWAFYIFYKGVVTTWEAVGFIILYVVYIVVVLAERINTKPSLPPEVIVESADWKSSDEASTKESGCISSDALIDATDRSPNTSLESSSRSLPQTPSLSEEEEFKPRRARANTVSTVQELAIHYERLQVLWAQGLEDELKKEKELEERVMDVSSSVEVPRTVNESTPLLPGASQHRASYKTVMKRFWKELRAGLLVAMPVEEDNVSCFCKILAWLQLPVVLVLKLLVPVVNYTSPRHGWCRSLNALHCVTCPMFCVLATQVANIELTPYFPIWALTGILGGIAALLVLFTTRHDRPPRFHSAFAFLGFTGSVVTIYMVANEVVNLLRAIGILSHMSDTMLGMTVLAWGNSIGDFITNFSIARQGFERMGFSACYGGPLFNILLGIGISFTMATVESGEHRIYIHYGEVGPMLAFFLALSLISSLLAFPLMKFTARRSYGFYLLALYLAFLVSATLLELGLLPQALLSAVPTISPTPLSSQN